MSNKKNRRPNSSAQHMVPSEEMATSRRQVSVSTAQYHHSGPIPDPMTLERYESILPGSAERILVMAEEQAAHRKKMESIVIRSGSRDSLLGIIAGFILAGATIVAGTMVLLKGHVWGGTILGSAGLVGLVSVFIYGTNSSRKERLANK